MYELLPPDDVVAAQIDGLPRRAWNDYEAAIAFVLDRPWDAEAFNTRTMGNARLRRFGLDRGSILYTPMSDRRSVLLNSVHYTA